jgi:hypothetical protein
MAMKKKGTPEKLKIVKESEATRFEDVVEKVLADEIKNIAEEARKKSSK